MKTRIEQEAEGKYHLKTSSKEKIIDIGILPGNVESDKIIERTEKKDKRLKARFGREKNFCQPNPVAIILSPNNQDIQ